MINGVIIKKLTKFEDQRGWLSEIYRSDETDYRPVMSYVSMTKPGVVRGPHEHIKQSDAFVFLGPGNFELHLWDRRENSNTHGEYQKIVVGEENPSLVIVPPGVVHGYKCISDTPGFCINFPDQLYKGKDKKEESDELRWEEDPDSPYKIK
jgi:dTDP-4-dehydrorhamnose 3,5-epimerase